MKMKSIMFLSIGLLFFLLTSCCKENICDAPIDPCELEPCIDTSGGLMGKLDTLWSKKLLVTGKSPGIQQGVFVHAEDIVVSYTDNPVGMIACFNSNNKGNLKWMFNEGSEGFLSTYLHPIQGLVVSKTYTNRVSLKLETGEIISNYKSSEFSGPRGILLGDYIYYHETEDNGQTAHLRRSPILQLEIVETLYTLDNNQIDNQKKTINSMNLWLDPISGDSILIFQHRMLNRVDVLAWNMSKREVKWRHDDITNLGNSNHQQILIYDNKAYFGGGTTFYCFEIISGQILWKYDHPSGINSFMLYNPVVAEDEKLIVVKDAGGEFRGFDLMTGTVRMFSAGSGSSTASSGSPIYYKGVVYFTERGLLYAIRATNGSLLWSERSSRHPMGSTSFQGELAIDRERGILYATDEDELFAIRVIE